MMTTVIAVISLIIAIYAIYHSKQIVKGQNFLTFFEEYRSVNMYDALRGLYDFKRKYKEKTKIQYEKRKKQDDTNVELMKKTKKPNAEIVDYIKTTLHYQRRIIAHFYIAIETALKERIILKNQTLRYFNDKEMFKLLQEIEQNGDGFLSYLLEKVEEFQNRHPDKES